MNETSAVVVTNGASHVLPSNLPAPVRAIAEEAARYSVTETGRAATRAIWEREVALARTAAPGALVEDGGETLRVGELSPGCVACKSGAWDCVFVTMRCNLSCPFCLRSDGAELAGPRGAFGDDPAALIERYAAADVVGVSFSGGEPFLDPEAVLRWVSLLRKAMPGVYLWAYTNGRPLTARLLARLADAGLDELRFNLAATGYRDGAVLSLLAEAVRTLSAVAVEVPAIPAHREVLLGSLEMWADLGVRYLNLHELVYEPASASGRMAGEREARAMPDGHVCDVDPGSAILVRELLAHVCAARLPLGANDCSLRNKARQLRGRRALLAPFTLRPYEVSRDDGLAESALVFSDSGMVSVPVAECRRVLAGRGPGWRAARVLRVLPLEIGGRGRWAEFEVLDAEETPR